MPHRRQRKRGRMSTWHILRTMTLRETTVAGEITTGLGLRTYVPIEVGRMPKRGVVFERRRPLIPGYVFVRSAGGYMPWRDLRELKHVVGHLDIDGHPAAIHDSEIDRIREYARVYNKALTDRRTLNPGDKVRPTRGPFESIESLLRTVKGSTATIEVQMLGSVREVQVPVSSLEKVA